MICFPNAKINIGLNILRKREDGYHDIESVMYPLKEILYDALEIITPPLPSPKERETELYISGIPVQGGKENNLCVKAYEMLKKDFNLPPVKIYLHKAIPMGAGLGGGSADGAFMLKLLNDEFELKLSEKKLMSYASKLGSDCPFFIRNEAALVTGRGSCLTPYPSPKERGESHEHKPFLSGYYIVVIYPNIHVSTAEAYGEWDKGQGASDKEQGTLNNLIKLPIEKWKNTIVNDFEAPVFKKHPVLKKIKEKLYSLGAVYASMSGSGSAVYGIFEKEVKVKKQFKKFNVWDGKLT